MSIEKTKKPSDDGGPAFARPGIEGMCGSQNGMSLRDYFAVHLMTGYLAMMSGDFGDVPDDTGKAKKAYKMADAMLAEREVVYPTCNLCGKPNRDKGDNHSACEAEANQDLRDE